MAGIFKIGVKQAKLDKFLETVDKWDTVLINQGKGGKFNIFASSDRAVKDADVQPNETTNNSEGDNDMSKNTEEMTTSQLIKAVYSDDENVATSAVEEVTYRVEKAQGTYTAFTGDKLLSKGDMDDVNTSTLIKAWDDDKKSKKAEKVIGEWLTIHDKLSKILD